MQRCISKLPNCVCMTCDVLTSCPVCLLVSPHILPGICSRTSTIKNKKNNGGQYPIFAHCLPDWTDLSLSKGFPASWTESLFLRFKEIALIMTQFTSKHIRVQKTHTDMQSHTGDIPGRSASGPLTVREHWSIWKNVLWAKGEQTISMS